MRLFFTVVAIVACAISGGFSIRAADEEPVATETPLQKSSPVTTASEESSLTTAQRGEQPEVLYTSPSGALRLEFSQPAAEVIAKDPDALGDVWVVSAKDPTQRAKLPKESADSPYDDEFHFSPNEEWLFGLRHVGSGLSDDNAYHIIMTPLKIDKPVNGDFNQVVWQNCVKLGALKEDYSAAGVYAITGFETWSFDSARLLIKLCGGEEKRSMRCGLLYFNTRTKKFEITDYLRKLNKTKSQALACAEVVDPLPSETDLKAKFDALDRQLNKRYAEVLAKMDKDQVANVREAQRNWIKHRDEGAKFYVSLFPAAEKERRHLQFLGDVTAARIETQPNEAWEGF